MPEVPFNEGDAEDYLYILTDGQVDIEMKVLNKRY
jgi:hypothetical protein